MGPWNKESQSVDFSLIVVMQLMQDINKRENWV
jgi:hypothetical protein